MNQNGSSHFFTTKRILSNLANHTILQNKVIKASHKKTPTELEAKD